MHNKKELDTKNPSHLEHKHRLGKAKVSFSRQLRILLATNAMILLAGATLAPIYAIFVENIGGDLLDASFAGGVFALAAGLTTLISGRVSDRIRENELIIVGGYIVMGLGFLLFTIVNSMQGLLLIQVMIGFGEAIYSPAFDAIYTKHMDNHNSGSSWGAWESMNYFTTAIGALLGGFIVNSFGFEVLFLFMAGLSFFSAFSIWLLPRKLL